MVEISVGSICSGIEAASVALKGPGFKFKWFSEIAEFPSRVLNLKYPHIPNLGDMNNIPELLLKDKIHPPDLICGGTPCQAFSLAGWKKGLEDARGNLTLKFVDIINTNDELRAREGLDSTMVLWENVEGVLRDKTNAFGSFVASLAGLESELNFSKWPSAGLIRGPKRNVAWRVLDAKYFGLPQQRRRLYVIAGGVNFFPENILFDKFPQTFNQMEKPLKFTKEGSLFESFRAYTDCLYSAYGTKWNGNAAAYNGSLFVIQNKKLRRLTPLECERLMGFPDDYTNVSFAKSTSRYQAIGNSWAIPVINWIGQRILDYKIESTCGRVRSVIKTEGVEKSAYIAIKELDFINGSEFPEKIIYGDIKNIIDVSAAANYYISPAGCRGILRRKEERGLKINSRLEKALVEISLKWTDEEIEAVSKRQKRGRLSVEI